MRGGEFDMKKYTGCVEIQITEGRPQVRRRDNKPRTPEDNIEAERLFLLQPDLGLNYFARLGGILRMWSNLHEGVIWFVGRKAQVSYLVQRGIPRQVIYAAQEVLSLYHLTIDPDRMPSVTEAKSLFLSDRKPIRSA